MANAPNTNSTLSLASGVNKTSTALSTNILVLVNNTPIGAIQRLAINESKEIAMIPELGTDGVIDSAPKSSAVFTADCERIRFDRLRIAEAFSRGFLHVSSQVYPFDIVIIDKQKRDRGSQISTVLKNVWFSQISYDYSATDWVISEKASLKFERIYSFLNNGNNVSAAVGGELGIKYAKPIISGDGIVNIEQLADVGQAGRGGALDAAGLIDIGLEGNLF